jgi:DNA polymerase (family 10)
MAKALNWFAAGWKSCRSDQAFTNCHLRFTIHQSMDNEQIARRFNRMASLMEVRGEDSFRVRSYRMAAEAIETWPTEMQKILAAEGGAGLQEIPGVGKAIAGKIIELLEQGTFAAWEKLTTETPDTVLDLLELPGIGPKTAAMLHQKFKISSLADLRRFVAGGGLETVDGIGPKTAERIKQSLQRRASN